MSLIERVGILVVPSIRPSIVGEEFVQGENGIWYVDPSFNEKMEANRRIPAQKGRRLACNELQEEMRSEQIIAALGGNVAAKTKIGDLLAALRSEEMVPQRRYVFFQGNCAVRVDRAPEGWVLHAFSLKAPGGWQSGRWIITPV